MLTLTFLALMSSTATATATLEGDLVRIPVTVESRRLLFRVDPVIDGAVIALATGLGLGSQLVTSSGELGFASLRDRSLLLGIDRPYATAPSSDTPDTVSNVIVAAALALASADTLLELVRDEPNGFWTIGVLYAETLAIELAAANLVKVAVRRPRPLTYALPPEKTDDTASFYSLHTAFVAGLGATATRLAFARQSEGVEAYLVLGGAALLTTFVGIERVEARKHFPTDVLTGAVVGAAIGALVPSLHGEWRVVPSGGGVTLSTSFD
ncbi:MAG: phosphatase PAP2 family protein [Deltaproteobacteria bacterium]|nr:phosphatase PAP2 family protein [Deltaproteobacteria bacterium]